MTKRKSRQLAKIQISGEYADRKRQLVIHWRTCCKYKFIHRPCANDSVDVSAVQVSSTWRLSTSGGDSQSALK